MVLALAGDSTITNFPRGARGVVDLVDVRFAAPMLFFVVGLRLLVAAGFVVMSVMNRRFQSARVSDALLFDRTIATDFEQIFAGSGLSALTDYGNRQACQARNAAQQ